jgi:hypothetical protein
MNSQLALELPAWAASIALWVVKIPIFVGAAQFEGAQQKQSGQVLQQGIKWIRTVTSRYNPASN